jgi:hypothetical protein
MGRPPSPGYANGSLMAVALSRRVSIASCWVAIAWTLSGCGASTASDAASLPDGSSAGSSGRGGSDAGQGSGGASGTGGATGTGGAAGAPVTGDAEATGDAPTCWEDGGFGLAHAARACQMDTDCEIATSATCCGADRAYGIARDVAAAYATCFGLPPNACAGLGCAKFLGYAADTGDTTQGEGLHGDPLAQIAVHCENQLCTSSVIPPSDAGSD